MLFYGISLAIIAAADLMLGFYILFRNPKNPVNFIFYTMSVSAALWILGNGYIDISNTEYTSIEDILVRLLYFAAALAVSGFFLLILYFPYRSTVTKKYYPWMILIYPIVTLILSLWSNKIIKYSYYTADSANLELGTYYLYFVIVFVFILLVSLISIVNKYQKSDGIHRWQLKWFSVGMIISFTVGMITNLLLPLFGIVNLGKIGPYLTIVWLGFSAYIIFRPRLTNRV